MADGTEIGWCDATWPIVVGCKEISPGCANCWAAKLAATRLKHTPKYRGLAVIGANGHPRFTGETRLWAPHLDWPLKWREPRRIFVASSGDLFHDTVSPVDIAAVFGVAAACPQHTMQILTKRPENARAWFRWIERETSGPHAPDVAFVVKTAASNLGIELDQLAASPWPLPNVHVGVSVEDRKHGLPRIDVLREIPAAVRWLSIEPLLEDLGTIDLSGISWIVVGGESGHGARPMHPAWVRSIRDQCVASGVPLFFKQWGEYSPFVNEEWFGSERKPPHLWLAPNGDSGACWPLDGDGSWLNWTGEPPDDTSELAIMSRVGKKRAGRLLDGREWSEFPEVRS